MNPVAWFLLANMVVTTLALSFAALAWFKEGNHARQARLTNEAYAPIAERMLQVIEGYEQLAAGVLPTARRYQNFAKRLYRDAGDTQEFEPFLDEHPTGRHALTDTIPAIDSTELMPAVGQLADVTPKSNPPMYFFDSLKGDAAR